MSPPIKPYVEGQTGSLSDVIERGPELAPFTPAGSDGFKSDPTWSQLFTAAVPGARRSTVIPDDTPLLNAYSPIVDALGLPPSENPARFYDPDPNTLAVTGALGQPSALATSAQQGESAPFGGQRLASRQLQESLIVDQIKARRAKDPNFLPGIPDTIDAFHSYADQLDAKARAVGAAVLARGSTFGRVTAGLAAGGVQSALHDPSFLPSMVLGGGTATSALQAVGRDALINGVFATVYAPADIYRSVVEDHEPLTTAVGEAATNIASAAVIGAAFGGTVHLAAAHVPPALFKVMPESVQARWAGRMRVGEKGPLLKDVLGDMDNRELSSFAHSTIGTRMTPDEKAAANVLERSQELGDASPFEPGPEGDAAHNTNLAASLKSIIDGAEHESPKADLLASTSPIGLRPPRPIATPTDAGFEAQWRAIVGNEGGTGAHGEFLTSPKGAIGPAQVMPGTAPYAAKLAGLPWDETRYRSDPAYNQALGRAYYAEQLQTFGDPDMAAAAYNTGPGSAARGTGLRGALKRAAEHGEPGNWEAYLPRETQRYVEDFRKRAGAAAGGDRAIDVAGGEDPALAELNRSADQAEADALELSRDRATAEPVPLLKRDLFSDDQGWADAQAAFHQSLNAPEETAGAPLSGETLSGPPELAPAPPARAAARPQNLEQWFAGSLIADDLGRPLTVYHGSGSEFDTFDVAHAGEGRGSRAERALFFSTDPEVASHSALVAGAGHATGEPTHMGMLSDNGGVVYPVHLRVENPLVSKLKFYNGEEFAKEIARAKAAGHDGVIFPHVKSRGENGTIAVFGPDQVRSTFADAVPVRIDEPELKSFDDGAAGRVDQVDSLEHDARVASADPAMAKRSYVLTEDSKPITLGELLDEFDRDRAAVAALRACAGGA